VGARVSAWPDQGVPQGRLTLASVTTAIRPAREYKVHHAEILALLLPTGLDYDAATQKLTDSLGAEHRAPRPEHRGKGHQPHDGD